MPYRKPDMLFYPHCSKACFEKSFLQSARPTLRYILQKAFFKHALKKTAKGKNYYMKKQVKNGVIKVLILVLILAGAYGCGVIFLQIM